MSEAFAYHLSFIPTDANASPTECMTAYCYETLVAAQMAAADDASATAKMHANAKEREEWAAYATTAANICAHALDGISTDAFPVHVRHGDNPRHVGTYRIVRLTEGDAMECSTCEHPGIVTYIGGRGNVIACCDDCREEEEKAERHRADYATIRTAPSVAITIPATLNVGDRVRFTRNVTRYPFVIITEGETGTISTIDPDMTEVTLDTRHHGLDDWDNALQIALPSHDIDDTDALEVFATRATTATCHKCGATDDLDTTPGRATTCHPCALDDDLRRHLAAN